MTVPTPSKAPVDQPWKWPTGSRKRRRNSEVADGSASDSEVLFPASKKHNKLTAEEDNEEDVGTAEAGKTGGGPDELETATSGNEVPDMLTAKEDAEKAAGTADAGTTGANTNGAGVKAQTSEAESMELHQMRRRKREMEASDDEEELIPMFTKYSKLTTETDDFSATQNRALKCFLSPQCTRLPAFTSVLGYEEHYAQAHVNVCKVCKRPKILPTRRLLDLHLMEVHDSFFAVSAERQAMYECFVDECPIKHSTIRQRRRHLMRVHGFPANFHFQVVEQGQQRDNYNYKPSTEEGQQNKQQNQENKKTKQKKLQNKLGEKKASVGVSAPADENEKGKTTHAEPDGVWKAVEEEDDANLRKKGTRGNGGTKGQMGSSAEENPLVTNEASDPMEKISEQPSDSVLIANGSVAVPQNSSLSSGDAKPKKKVHKRGPKAKKQPLVASEVSNAMEVTMAETPQSASQAAVSVADPQDASLSSGDADSKRGPKVKKKLPVASDAMEVTIAETPHSTSQAAVSVAVPQNSSVSFGDAKPKKVRKRGPKAKKQPLVASEVSNAMEVTMAEMPQSASQAAVSVADPQDASLSSGDANSKRGPKVKKKPPVASDAMEVTIAETPQSMSQAAVSVAKPQDASLSSGDAKPKRGRKAKKKPVVCSEVPGAMEVTNAETPPSTSQDSSSSHVNQRPPQPLPATSITVDSLTKSFARMQIPRQIIFGRRNGPPVFGKRPTPRKAKSSTAHVGQITEPDSD